MKKTKTLMFASVLLCAALSFAGGTKDTVSGSKAENKKSDTELSVVTTIFPIYDFTRALMYGAPDAQSARVLQNTADKIKADKALKLLVKPGMEIHSFDPSPADIAAIQKADVFIYNGGESDEWVHEILESMDISGKVVVRLTDYVDLVEEEIVEGMEHSHDADHDHAGHEAHEHHHEHDGHEAHEHRHEHDGHEAHEHHDGHHHEHEDEHSHEADEHIWTSPANAAKMVNAIRDALIKADARKSGGTKAGLFTKNAADYNREIKRTAETISSVVNKASDKFILMGDRFPLRYFVDYYGLEYRAAFSGCSTAVEANASTIAFLIDKAAERSVPAVFAMELSNRKIAQTVAEGAAKKGGTKPAVLELHTVHNLSKDDFKAGETWVSLMMRNAESLKKGLK
ncbi:metal ABC transporter substrate-binding protein [Treponema sp. HNW]|uniref:metal ABC transporter substrate-binding protein n=1 Tax=Treponema sp. HNW TaxID=3116654 RepID=UPI003D0D2ECD